LVVAVVVGQGLQLQLQPALDVEQLLLLLLGQFLSSHLQLELAELQRPEQHGQQPLPGLFLAREQPEVQLHWQHWQLILLLWLQEQVHLEPELQLLLHGLQQALLLVLVHQQGQALHLLILLGLHGAQQHGIKRCAKLSQEQSWWLQQLEQPLA